MQASSPTLLLLALAHIDPTREASGVVEERDEILKRRAVPARYCVAISPRRSNVALAWLVQKDLLCELSSGFRAWFRDFGKPEHEFDIDGHLEEDTSGECFALLGSSLDVEKLAQFLSELHRSVIAPEASGHVLEPLWLAEALASWTDREQAALTCDRNELHLLNWKFGRAMQLEALPILAFVAHLRERQLVPDEITYRQLLLHIDRAISDSATSIDLVVRRLRDDGIRITANLLVSLLRNDSRFLLIHAEPGLCVCRASEALKAWSLAAALLDPSEYIRTGGLGFDGKGYWQASYQVLGKPLMAFFNFHQADINWSRLDLLEIAVKLNQARANENTFTQGMPSAVHRFIVQWIQRTGRIWRSANSAAILGTYYRFHPEDISPGRLVVYGNAEAGRVGSGTLVLREMVSDGAQQRGKIHSSRIITPLAPVQISIDADLVGSVLSSNADFINWGVTHVDDLAERILRLHRLQVLPYCVKLAREACLSLLPATVVVAGRGILVSATIAQPLEQAHTIDARMHALIQCLLTQGASKAQLHELLSYRLAYALLR